MKTTDQFRERNSVQELQQSLGKYINASAGVIHIRAKETLRALEIVRQVVLTSNFEYREWDFVNGFREFTLQTCKDHSLPGDSNIGLESAFLEPMNVIRRKEVGLVNRIYAFVMHAAFMKDNVFLLQSLQNYKAVLPNTKFTILLVTMDDPLPDPLEALSIVTARLNAPGLAELDSKLQNFLETNEETVDDDARMRICSMGVGMGIEDFEMNCAVALVSHDEESGQLSDAIVSGLSVGKMEIINSNDLLELFPVESMDSVGGLGSLKNWISKRKGCFSDEARAFGIEPPKGIVVAGPPGTGKSLVVKSIAGVFGVPLIRLDFGRVFSSLVGSSEQRMRKALSMIEDCAPNVVMLDELDKGLGGIGGGNDSGVSMRVLGTFLSWLQECKAPVFVVATVNNVTGLPPELLRKGRFDEIFSVTFPNAAERRDILEIHCKKRGYELSKFSDTKINMVISKSEGYVGAEIEAAVKSGLVDAFSSGEEFSMNHVYGAISSMVPLSKSFSTQVAAMSEWAKNNATPAGGGEEATQQLSGRIVSRGKRTN